MDEITLIYILYNAKGPWWRRCQWGDGL